MAIEAVAGDSITGIGNAADSSDVGAGRMDDNSAFALPNDFDTAIDDGIEIPADESDKGATEGKPPGGATEGTVEGQQQVGQKPPVAPAGQQQPPGQQQPTVQQPAAQQPTTSTPVGDTSQPGRIFTPAELATQLGANREKMIDALAAQKFALTPAETAALEVDAVGVLPKIMARVYFEATVNGLQQLANMVPRMVEHVTSERLAQTSAESEFHTEWPNIDKSNAQHMQTVQQLAASYRQMNPTASQKDAIKFVGMAATNFLGLQMPQRGQQQQQQSRPSGQSQPRRGGAPPFSPASGGRAQPLPGQVQAKEPGDEFNGLGIHFDG